MEQKSPDAFRTISEVAEWLGVPTHVLRFWESRFTQVKPVKRAGGRRYYRPSDMELLGGIRKLLHEDGMTIRGVQKLLREEGIKHVAAMSPALDLDAEGDDASNVVSLSDHARASDADIEDAEVVEDDETTLSVDDAIEDGAVAPVDPEDDRPVTYGTGEDAGPSTVETASPTLSDEMAYDEDAAPTETEDRVEDADENMFADPLESAEPVEDAPDEALSDENLVAEDDPAAADTADTDTEEDPRVEMVTSAALPEEDDPWALESNEPEAPVEDADTPDPDDALEVSGEAFEEDTPEASESEWDPAIEVSGADDSDIATPLDAEPAHTEEPNISRAAPIAAEDSALNTDDEAPAAFEPETPEPAYLPEDAMDEREHTEADEVSAWSEPEARDPVPDEREPDPVDYATPEPEDARASATPPSDMPIDAGYSDYAPVLVMPDIDDDPADGTLPPDIAPVGPRLRRLRSVGLRLPAAHLAALSDRLKTLGGETDDGVLR